MRPLTDCKLQFLLRVSFNFIAKNSVFLSKQYGHMSKSNLSMNLISYCIKTKNVYFRESNLKAISLQYNSTGDTQQKSLIQKRGACENRKLFSCFKKRRKSFYDGTRLPNKPNLRNPFSRVNLPLHRIMLTVLNFCDLRVVRPGVCLIHHQANKTREMQSKLTRCKNDHKIALATGDQFGMIK